MQGYTNCPKKILGATSKFQALDWLHEASSIPRAKKLRLGFPELCLLALVYIYNTVQTVSELRKGYISEIFY